MSVNTDSKKNNILFWIILLILPFLLFTFVELGLRLFDYGDDLSLFKQATGDKSDYMYLNRWVAKRYFSNQGIPDPTNDVFLKSKPENGYRIFVLGGSTAAGWPYSNNIMFSRILQKRLSDAFPEKYIEVVNTSISAINSYTYMDFVDEILDYKPDLVLLYGGHNEYYGAFGVASTQTIGNMRWIKKLYLKFVHYKTFQLLKNIYFYLHSLISSGSESDQSTSSTLMEDLVNEQSIKYDSELYGQGLVQFEENLSDIFNATKSNGIPVIVSELVSNIRDQTPFKSIGRSQDESASVIYKQSRQYLSDEKYDEAKHGYYRAKDMDGLRFRASEDLNEIINKVESYDGVYIVPLKKYFEMKSENQLIGDNLMLDHLHPNIDGHFIIADAFFREINNNQLISNKIDAEDFIPSDDYRNDWGYSILDSIYAHMKVNHLKSGWPFKPNKRDRLSKENIPSDIVEKIAFRIWRDRSYTSEDGHADLASYFESQGKFENAFHEYNSLTCLKPLNITAYLKAADASIKAGNMKRALPFLEYSLKLEETAFAYKWIGLIQLNENNLDGAIRNLEIVYDLEIKDVELFYNLGLAYYQSGNYSKMNTMLSEIKKMNINDAQVKWMINTLENLMLKSEEK